MKAIFEPGEIVKCIGIDPLKGNDVRPPLELNKLYRIKAILLDSKGNQHIDVGLPSAYNFIRSYETGEHLANGAVIHWCHPSRFEKGNIDILLKT